MDFFLRESEQTIPKKEKAFFFVPENWDLGNENSKGGRYDFELRVIGLGGGPLFSACCP